MSGTAQPTTMSVTDMRAQILANAMIAFPHIVDSHARVWSTIPPQTQNIFEVSVSVQHPDRTPIPHYVARLTHRHMREPALNFLVLSGALESTVELALSSLLDYLSVVLGDHQECIIARLPETRNVPTALHGNFEGDLNAQMGYAMNELAHVKDRAKRYDEQLGAYEARQRQRQGQNQ